MKLTIEQLSSITHRVRLSDALEAVLIDVGGNPEIPLSEHNSNIYCIDNLKRILWQVPAPAPLAERDSFVELEQGNESLLAVRFFGSVFEIDSVTGVAKETGWRK